MFKGDRMINSDSMKLGDSLKIAKDVFEERKLEDVVSKHKNIERTR